MLKRELLKLLEDVPDDAPINIINDYEEMDNTSYDILQVITTKSVNYDICRNNFNENEKRKSVETFVYLLKEVDQENGRQVVNEQTSTGNTRRQRGF